MTSHPPRIVHLQGGLRAVDDLSGKISIQISGDAKFAQFAAPEYAKLYGTLRALGLTSIGVEFVNHDTYRGLAAPDWQCAGPNGFDSLREFRAWSNIRTAAFEDKEALVADIASRMKTYLTLLSIRVFQLSNAYNQTIRGPYGSLKAGEYFNNAFQRYMDAAIHGSIATMPRRSPRAR